jgi:DNA-binding response OmpR family regulator
MTASAIQGDREKCLESGMNNYLAKPVRAQTLKALLDSYLSRPEDEKEIPDLQAEAKKLVKEALKDVAEDEVKGGVGGPVVGIGIGASGKTGSMSPEKVTSRPSSIRMNTTQLWRPHEDANGKGDNGHS